MEDGHSSIIYDGQEHPTDRFCYRCSYNTGQAKTSHIHQPYDVGYESLASDMGDDERSPSPSPSSHKEAKARLVLVDQIGSFGELAGTSAHCGPHSSRRWKKPVAKMRRKMRQVSESLANKFKIQDLTTPRVVLHKRKSSCSAPTSALIQGKRTRAQVVPDTRDTVSSVLPKMADLPTCSVWHRGQQVFVKPISSDACTTANKDFESIYNCYDIDRTSKESLGHSLIADPLQNDGSSDETIRTSLEYTSRAHVLPCHGRFGKSGYAIDTHDDATSAMISAFLQSQRQTLSYQDRLHEAEVNKLELKMELKMRDLENVIKQQILHVKEEASQAMKTKAESDQLSCANLSGTTPTSSIRSRLPIRHNKPWVQIKSTTASTQPYSILPMPNGKENIEQNSDDYAYKPQSPNITRQLEEVMYHTISNES